MVAWRRLWWMLVLGVLATVAMACSGGSGKVSLVNNDPSTERGAVPAPQQQQTNGSLKPAGNGAAPAGNPAPGPGTGLCKDCQTSKDSVRLSDADGFEFETGEAEAGRMQNAGTPTRGDEKATTFDAGRGMTGTTGSSNLKPR
jgi:hypothetical protein